MFSVAFVVCVLGLFLNAHGTVISRSDEIVSPLRIAQCRSRCLEKFSASDSSHDSCLQGPDCFMCWENCELLQANFQIWGSICATDICYPGCQEACKFHRESPQKKQVEPVIKARGEELLKVNDGVARWPRPGAVRSESPLIYIVMRRNQDSSWTQVIQTVGRSVRLPPDTATTALRVLVVNPDGLVTMYSPMSLVPSVGKLSESKVSRILAGVVGPRNDKVNLNTPKSSSWGLKEVSLIHQKILVLAEVAWEPRMDHAEYLVTWEVDGGGLKGNLFTDTTSVTLSLWPDTVYHIQVELVSQSDKSAPLTLDTHKALQVNFDITHTTQSPMGDTDVVKPSRKIFESRKDVTLEEEIDVPKLNLQQSPTRISSPLSSVVVKAETTAAHLIDNRQETELILGSVAAVVLFLVMLVLLALRARRLQDEFLLGSISPKLIPEDRHHHHHHHNQHYAKPIIMVTEKNKEMNFENVEFAGTLTTQTATAEERISRPSVVVV